MTVEETVPTETSRVSRTTGGREAGPLLARFARPRASESTTLAVVSDPHVSTSREGTWKVFHSSGERLATALSDAAARGVDAVVLSGDLTKDGERADFEAVERLVAGSVVPTLAIPGNHDVPKDFDEHDGPPVAAFAEAFTPGGLPFYERVGGIDLIGLNSASAPDGSLRASHDGTISADQLDWLDGVLAEAENPLVVSHHNLPGLLATEAFAWRSSLPVGNAEALVAIMDDHDAPLHVSGHLHVPAVARSGNVRELVAPSLCSFPQAYLLVTIDETGTTVRLAPVAGPAEVVESYMLAQDDSAHSQAVVELVAEQLRALPLADERTAACSQRVATD